MVDWEAVANWVVHNIIQICVILSVFIQITPIKCNPWTRFFNWIGGLINKEPNAKIDSLLTATKDMENSITKLNAEVDENEKDRIRWEILDFANSCRNNRRHTKDEFQHMIDLNDKYKSLLAKTNDKNGVFEAEYEYIKKLYAERQAKNDFL